VRARASSERLVAFVRLGLIAALVASSLGFSLQEPAVLFLSIPLSTFALIYGFSLVWLSKRIVAPWFAWVTSALDVSLASAAICAFIVFDEPLAVLNNRVAYETYFVSVTISALRYDWRLCAFTAALALAQYGGMSAFVATHWNLSGLTTPTHGTFVASQFVNRLVILAGHGVGTMAIAQWARHLRLMIGTDHLTGLLQRRPFLERVDEELARADPARSQLGIAVFDVDEFKRFNDEFGHLAGDRALERIAEQLKLAVRTTDLVARYGGEEFVIAFPRMDVQLALERVRDVCARVGAIQLTPEGRRLTLSAGVACWPSDGMSFEAVLDAADQRLYAAKRSGRNLVIGPAPTGLPSVAGSSDS